MKYLILSMIISAAFAVNTTAQTSYDDQSRNAIDRMVTTDLSQCVYLDADEKICYVDLEKVPVNLKQAVLINASGDEVVNKPLEELPVNSIVELDYSHLPSGSYILELRSYRGTTHKALRL